MGRNINENNVSEWVDQCLADLGDAPVMPADPERALSQFYGSVSREKGRQRARIWLGVSATLFLAVFLALPSTRSLAQRLWNKVFPGHYLVVRTSQFEESVPPPPKTEDPVADLSEAAARIGFVPRLPAPQLLEGLPSWPLLRIVEYEDFDVTVRVADIKARLQRAGVNPADVSVPPEWDGVVIRNMGGRAVLAIYASADKSPRLMLQQGSWEGLAVPPGFSLERFLEIFLRTIGLNAAQARERRSQFAVNPFGILVIPPDYDGTIQQVSLRSGPALLIVNNGDNRKCFMCPDAGELYLWWNRAGRSYRLAGAGVPQEQAIRIANSID